MNRTCFQCIHIQPSNDCIGLCCYHINLIHAHATTHYIFSGDFAQDCVNFRIYHNNELKEEEKVLPLYQSEISIIGKCVGLLKIFIQRLKKDKF